MIKLIITIFLTFVITLNAQILKDSKLEKIEKEKEKSFSEAELLKNSWINPLNIEADISKSMNDNNKTTTKRVYLDINQDIFRSGGIYYTIKKAEIEKQLSKVNYKNNLSIQKTEAVKLVLNIQKLDLQIKKHNFLVKNKNIEISKKEAEYLNGTIDIEELDTAIIEKNILLNDIEDLSLSKHEFIKSLKTYTNTSYEKIYPIQLDLVNFKDFLNNNQELILKKLNSDILKYDKKISTSEFYPKISIYSQIGYESINSTNVDDDFYNYGIKITIPIDYNMNKKKQISKLTYKLSKINFSLNKEKEENRYEFTIKSLKHVNKKIQNSKLTIQKYKDIYSLTNQLVEGLLKTKEDLITIDNRLSSSKLDIDILNIDKQLLIYDINNNIKNKIYY